MRGGPHYSLLKRAGAFGIEPGTVGFDWAKVMARKEDIIRQTGVAGAAEKFERQGIALFQGEASFQDEHSLRVAGQVLHKDRPFFLYLAHNNPHVPLVAKQELIAKHKHAFNPVYAAMIETLDDCVGRLLAKLDALGLAENTFVVLTSDNGGLHVLELLLTPATFN